MGSDPTQRAHAYQQWLNAGIAPDDLQQLRAYASQERALGDERFQRMVETTLGRPAVCRLRGRPPRAGNQERIN
jgi:putative transposase